MPVNLNKAHEIDHGLISNGVIDSNTIFESARSSTASYSGDLVSSIDYFNGATRIARQQFTYLNDFVTQQLNIFYSPDGVSIYKQETIVFNYVSDNINTIEVS